MEEMTLTFESVLAATCTGHEIILILRDAEEVPVGGKSVAQWVSEIEREGWEYVRSIVQPMAIGVVLTCYFKRALRIP